jgi:hypothetical protein
MNDILKINASKRSNKWAPDRTERQSHEISSQWSGVPLAIVELNTDGRPANVQEVKQPIVWQSKRVVGQSAPIRKTNLRERIFLSLNSYGRAVKALLVLSVHPINYCLIPVRRNAVPRLHLSNCTNKAFTRSCWGSAKL